MPTPTSPGRPIVVGHLHHTFYEVAARVLAGRLDGLGHEVTLVEGAHGELYPRLAAGEIDMLVATWAPHLHAPFYDPVKRHLTTLGTLFEGAGAFWQQNTWDPNGQGYYRIAGSGLEVEPMRHADDYPDGTPARGIAGYSKPAVSMHALRGLIGEDRFRPIYKEYARRWAFKHPQPYDLFNTFEDQLGEDLDWFWRTMFYETWTLDQAVASVDQRSEQVVVTVEDRGLSPMPARVRPCSRGAGLERFCSVAAVSSSCNSRMRWARSASLAGTQSAKPLDSRTKALRIPCEVSTSDQESISLRCAPRRTATGASGGVPI